MWKPQHACLNIWKDHNIKIKVSWCVILEIWMYKWPYLPWKRRRETQKHFFYPIIKTNVVCCYQHLKSVRSSNIFQWSISQKFVSLRLIVSVIVSVISKPLIGWNSHLWLILDLRLFLKSTTVYPHYRTKMKVKVFILIL